MIDLSIFERGNRIEITRAAHPYRHMGYVDHKTIIPENIEVMTVKSKRQTKNGLKVHFANEQNCGYAIDVERATLHTFRKV